MTKKKNTMKTIRITSLSLAFAGGLALSGPAAADCGEFPNVPWWGNLNADKVATYVSHKHDGNWGPYITKWSTQVDKLKDVHRRGSAVFVRYKGKKVKIAGDALANYIKLVEKRVDIVQCLAQSSSYANFATAAGDEKKKQNDK